MRNILLFIVFFSFQFSVLAQITFQKIYGGSEDEFAYCIQRGAEENYIIAGRTNSFGAGDDDYYLISINSSGDTIWTKTFGGAGGEQGLFARATSDGGYIMAGQSTAFGPGYPTFYLVKTNSTGNLLWSKTYGWFSGGEYPESVQETTDGGYVLFGSTSSFGSGTRSFYLIKTDSSGNPLWYKTYGGLNAQSCRSGHQTSDGGFILFGYTTSFGAGANDFYLVKTDSSGNLLWSKTYGGGGDDHGFYIRQTNDDGYILGGWTFSFGVGSSDAYLVRTDSAGNLIWSKTYGGFSGEGCLSVQQTSDSGFIFVGSTSSFTPTTDAYAVKTNAVGDTIWSRLYQAGTSDDNAFSVLQIPTGYFIAGRTIRSGHEDVYLIKTDNYGNSGCNDIMPPILVTLPATQTSNAGTLVSTGGTMLSPSTIVSSGGTVDILCATNTLETNVGLEIAIYPNPATKFIVISSPLGVNSIEMYNLLGERKYAAALSSKQSRINIENFHAGIYFVKMQTENGGAVQKLVVE